MKKILISLLLCGILLPAQAQTQEKTVALEPSDRYLNFPIDRSGDKVKARIILGEEVLDEFTLKLARTREETDFWTFFRTDRYQGQDVSVEVDQPSLREQTMGLIHADATFPGQDSLYREAYRQQLHFSSQRGWNNDPNGLVYEKGTYHLFYQHNPYGWNWGNMHWGHAVSKDLIHWEERANALFTPTHEQMAFSGSAAIADENSSGFTKNGVHPIVAAYTRTGVGENLALSYDGGQTFESFDGNPVVEHDGRDPKIFWYEPGGHWVMVVYDESHTRKIAGGESARLYQHAIYTSPDLKDWQYQSAVSGFFECPELLKMPVKGQPGTSKWVMYGADGKYMVGTFNGKEFTVEQPLTKYEHGGAFYASQMYNNTPDGRPIQIGWFQITTENMPFNQCMTIPMKLTLEYKKGQYLLNPSPVKELSKLHDQTHVFEDKLLTGEDRFKAPVAGELLHLTAEFELGDAHRLGLNINGYKLTYNHLRGDFNGVHYKIPHDQPLKIEVVVDRSSMEVFVNDGELYFAEPHDNVKAEKTLEVFSNGGGESAKSFLKRLEVHRMQSIWK